MEDIDTDDGLRKKFEDFLKNPCIIFYIIDINLDKIKMLILTKGLPSETEKEINELINEQKCTLRGKIWKLLLDIKNLNSGEYLKLVEKGPSFEDNKLRLDTYRTFPTDVEYNKRAPENKLIRLLNAFIHKYGIKKKDRNRIKRYDFTYVQGMNVLAAPFLYVMPELDSFKCFCKLITYNCPRYVSPNLMGVHDGCSLLDECIKSVLFYILFRLILNYQNFL